MTVIDYVTSLMQCGVAIILGLSYFTCCMWCTCDMESSLDSDSDTTRSDYDDETTQFCNIFDVSLAVVSVESELVVFDVSKAFFDDTKYVSFSIFSFTAHACLILFAQ